MHLHINEAITANAIRTNIHIMWENPGAIVISLIHFRFHTIWMRMCLKNPLVLFRFFIWLRFMPLCHRRCRCRRRRRFSFFVHQTCSDCVHKMRMNSNECGNDNNGVNGKSLSNRFCFCSVPCINVLFILQHGRVFAVACYTCNKQWDFFFVFKSAVYLFSVFYIFFRLFTCVSVFFWKSFYSFYLQVVF